jgi:hypothetical protein
MAASISYFWFPSDFDSAATMGFRLTRKQKESKPSSKDKKEDGAKHKKAKQDKQTDKKHNDSSNDKRSGQAKSEVNTTKNQKGENDKKKKTSKNIEKDSVEQNQEHYENPFHLFRPGDLPDMFEQESRALDYESLKRKKWYKPSNEKNDVAADDLQFTPEEEAYYEKWLELYVDDNLDDESSQQRDEERDRLEFKKWYDDITVEEAEADVHVDDDLDDEDSKEAKDWERKKQNADDKKQQRQQRQRTKDTQRQEQIQRQPKQSHGGNKIVQKEDAREEQKRVLRMPDLDPISMNRQEREYEEARYKEHEKIYPDYVQQEYSLPIPEEQYRRAEQAQDDLQSLGKLEYERRTYERLIKLEELRTSREQLKQRLEEKMRKRKERKRRDTVARESADMARPDHICLLNHHKSKGSNASVLTTDNDLKSIVDLTSTDLKSIVDLTDFHGLDTGRADENRDDLACYDTDNEEHLQSVKIKRWHSRIRQEIPVIVDLTDRRHPRQILDLTKIQESSLNVSPPHSSRRLKDLKREHEVKLNAMTYRFKQVVTQKKMKDKKRSAYKNLMDKVTHHICG